MSGWRLSPHPPTADRPWRAVGIYAWHGIREQTRSWAFWLMILTFPLMSIGLAVVQGLSQTRTERVVVVPDAALRAHAEAALPDSAWKVVERAPQADHLVTLQLDGTPAAFTANLRSSDPEEDLETHAISATGIVRDVRAQIWLQPGERDALTARVEVPDAAITTAETRERFARYSLPVCAGLALFLGLTTGVSAASRMQKQRDEPFFALLRLSTPASVMYLGGLVESLALSLTWTLPYVLPGMMFAGVLLVAQLHLSGPEIGPGPVVGGALFLAAAFPAAVATAAGARTLMTGVGRGVPGLEALGGMVPLLMMALATRGAQMLPWLESPGARPLSLVPALGMVPMAIAARDSAWGWLAAGGLVQAFAALALVRAAAWAYGLEEPPLVTLRRRWRAR